jgi:hypothetical protein
MDAEKKVSGPVDVLAVLDEAVCALQREGNDQEANDLLNASAAVAELIEACKYMSSHSDAAHWSRFHAALANVGSAS